MPNLIKFESPPSLRELAYESIKEGIISDKVKSGVVYNENAFARVLGISKTPVHEAILDLSGKGFIEIIPRKGFMVNDLSEKDMRDLYEFRIYLETSMVEKVAVNVTEQSIKRLELLLDEGAEASRMKDLKAFMKNDKEFHMFLASLSENHYAVSALRNIRDLVDWLTCKILFRQNNAEFCVVEHGEIVQMLKTKDGKGAAAKMNTHLLNTLGMLLGS